MNSFDGILILATLAIAVVGYRSGLIRSAVTILGYVVAMPIAVWITSLLVPKLAVGYGQPLTRNSLVFFAAFLACGMVMGSLLRLAVDDMIGTDINIGDRLAGAVLGAVRVLLVAVTLVMIFDRLVPANAQPFYLVGSQLRPLLSSAGQAGVKQLPPDALAYIDQLKRSRGI